MLLLHPSSWAQDTAVSCHPRTCATVACPHCGIQITVVIPRVSDSGSLEICPCMLIRHLNYHQNKCIWAPGPLVSLLYWVPVHQTWYQKAFPLDRTPCHRGKKRRIGRPHQSLPPRTPTALVTVAAYRISAVLVKEEPYSLCQC